MDLQINFFSISITSFVTLGLLIYSFYGKYKKKSPDKIQKMIKELENKIINVQL